MSAASKYRLYRRYRSLLVFQSRRRAGQGRLILVQDRRETRRAFGVICAIKIAPEIVQLSLRVF